MIPNQLAVFVLLLLFSTAGASAPDIDWTGPPAKSALITETAGFTAIPRPPAAVPVKIEANEISAVRMVDTLNQFQTRLTASASTVSDGWSYIITNEAPSAPPYAVEVIVRGEDDPIEAKGVGVSKATPREILERYGAGVDMLLATGKYSNETGQINYTFESRSADARRELALIMFMVDEWFYY